MINQIIIQQMKKNLGIIRNKIALYQQTKIKIQRKKTRFQIVGKDQQQITDRSATQSEQLLTSTSINSAGDEKSISQEIYNRCKQKLDQVQQIQKQISNQAKARLTSFKQNDNNKYDANIAKLASEATDNLMLAEKYLKQFKNIETSNAAQKKFIQNMEVSLAQQIRQSSRALRQKQKQYFDRLRSYEKNTVNTAIQLTPEQKQSMKFMQEEMQQQVNDMQNKNIDELVKSINKLSSIYKQLNELVIEQGSIIDRIDVNIDSTLQHTQKAVVHLHNANEEASSEFADRFIKILVILIMISALMLGFKYMNK